MALINKDAFYFSPSFVISDAFKSFNKLTSSSAFNSPTIFAKT